MPDDFDRHRLPGWAWTDVLDDFRAIETDLDFDTPAHGGTGPIPVRRTSDMTGATATFVAATERAGFSWIADLSDVGAELPSGVGAVPLNIVDGVRTGPGRLFCCPRWGDPT